MKEEKKGYLYLVLFAILNGFVGVLVKFTSGISAQELTFLRGAITILFISSVVLITKRLKDLHLVRSLSTFLVGLCEGLSVYLYFLAIQKTSIANAIFLVYSAPVFSVILARLFLKEMIEKATMVGLVATMVGILLIADPRQLAFFSDQVVGNALALASGALYAGMAFFAKPILPKATGYYVVFWQYLVITLLFLFFLPQSPIYSFIANWWQILVMGVLSTGLAFVLFMEGVKRVKSQKVFIVTSLEPVMSTLFAFTFLREIPTLSTILGAIIVLLGVYQITKEKI